MTAADMGAEIMGHGLVYNIRHWLIRTIARGDVVAMNFVSDNEAALHCRAEQQAFLHRFEVRRAR